MKEIKLKKGKEESLGRFHPWIFSGAIAVAPADGIEEGEVVRVVGHDGRVLGLGDWQIGSIAVRMLHFGPVDVDVDESFFQGRLEDAYSLRRSLGLIRADNDSYRLVHGEGDFLPGLVIDVYGDTAVMQAHSVAMHYRRMMLSEILTRLPDLGIRNVYYKSETTLPYKARLDPQNDYLKGAFATDVALENGLKFRVDWLKGQKTGFFLDQRDNRSLLEKYSCGRSVLNMFCYTGGFSVYAMRGGARRVVSVDSSAKAIALTDSNMQLNFPGDSRHESVAEDAFKYLDSMKDREFDLIVLDPPAFAKHRSAIPNALRGYQKLNAAAMRKIAPGGVIFTFSCSQAISARDLRLAVFSAAASTGRKVRILHQMTQPADHPVSIYHPEGEYLKGLILAID
ncbi:MAG: class I SAM-dependent rRNA methyltransferase [Muribaculaceae bacterium]|nr:class I SAM-dependent rRNA methyltransferase [Muribaculaceae bacterium]